MHETIRSDSGELDLSNFVGGHGGFIHTDSHVLWRVAKTKAILCGVFEQYIARSMKKLFIVRPLFLERKCSQDFGPFFSL